ncbi:hypothetical protein TNCV_1512261 [Trichonephila clavipes]|nr:hypothetical protein TNCV_1512261 [Trichonephila clavipes]
MIASSRSCAIVRRSFSVPSTEVWGEQIAAALRMIPKRCVCRTCSDLMLFGALVWLIDDFTLSHFLFFPQLLHFERFVASQSAGHSLPTSAAIFESVKPLLNLCDPHSIVGGHLLNLTNCFAQKITFDKKFDAVPLFESFDHL